MSHQSGMGLIEVLIGLFLSTLILTALMQFYLSNKRQYIEIQKQLENYFDVQWVSELLSNSIRRAGFTPCLGINHLTTINNRGFKQFIPAIKIAYSPTPLIQVNRMSEYFAQIYAIHSPTQLIVSDKVLFKERHSVLIADCEHAEIHRVLRIDKWGNKYVVTLTKPLKFSYALPYVGEWLEEQWFIKQNEKKVNALYYKLLQAEELTPLIHSLKINKIQMHEKQLIEIVMDLNGHKTKKVLVAVRGL